MNLSIFNFKELLSGMEKLFSLPSGSITAPLTGYDLSLESFLYPLVSAVILIIIFIFLKRLKSPWGPGARAVVAVLILRIILFYNPACWAIYNLFLDADDIGYRQKDVIKYELKRYLTKPAEINYLAVGTSQTGVVYREWALTHDDFVRFYLSGFSLMDLMLYREFIVSYHPRCILLWLSEFDLAHAPAFDAVKIAPPQWGYWSSLFGRVHSLSIWDETDTILCEMAIGEVFPAYKYSFVFQGITDRLFGQRLALGERRVTAIPDQERLRRQLRNLRNLEKKNIEFNLAFLKDFLRFASRRNLPVIIVEGQYNPQAYNQKNLRLNKITRRKLRELSEDFENVYFIPREKIFVFREDQYQDGYHVKSSEGLEFSQKLVNYLEDSIFGDK